MDGGFPLVAVIASLPVPEEAGLWATPLHRGRFGCRRSRAIRMDPSRIPSQGAHDSGRGAGTSGSTTSSTSWTLAAAPPLAEAGSPSGRLWNPLDIAVSAVVDTARNGPLTVRHGDSGDLGFRASGTSEGAIMASWAAAVAAPGVARNRLSGVCVRMIREVPEDHDPAPAPRARSWPPGQAHVAAAERRTRTFGVRVTTAEAAEIAERAGAARHDEGRLHAPQGAGAAGPRGGRPTVSAPRSGSSSTGSA